MSLRRLEYRGYDSAGIAVIDDAGALSGSKAEGKLGAFGRAAGQRRGLCTGTSASVTRAGRRTAGRRMKTPTRIWTARGKIAVVHNGIIENYAALRAELHRRGPHLRERDRHRGARPPDRDATTAAIWSRRCAARCPRSSGAFALGVISSDAPGPLDLRAQRRLAAGRRPRRRRDVRRLRYPGDPAVHA